MPINKTMSDAMLGTFRQMVKDCTDKGYSGEPFNKICSLMQQMEDLATALDDFTAFSTKLTTGGYFMNFSTEYGKVLSNAATAQYSLGGGNYNDDALLQQTINAYKDSLTKFEQHPDKVLLVKAVQEVIDMAGPGVNYPTFLRRLIEQGLDKAMEGTIVNRKYLEAAVKSAEERMYPPMLRRSQAILHKYDELAASTASGIPNTVVFFLEQSKIIDDTEADFIKYQHILSLWFSMITQLHTWIDAHTNFATTDERFAGGAAAATQFNISRSKHELPGKIKVSEMQLYENYGLGWEAIFDSESFIAETATKRFNYTDVYINFIRNDVYPQCIPMQSANRQLILKAESLYRNALQ